MWVVATLAIVTCTWILSVSRDHVPRPEEVSEGTLVFKAVEACIIKVDGEAGRLGELLGMLDEIAPDFPISNRCKRSDSRPCAALNKIFALRTVLWWRIAGMTSSGLTRSKCAVLACFGHIVAEMSLKRLAQTD